MMAARLRRFVRRTGWPVLAATTLLVAGLVLYFAGTRRLHDEVQVLRVQAELAQQQLRSGKLQGVRGPATVPEQLRAFHAFFPRTDSLPHWLETIHRIGGGAGLVIRAGEYRLERPEQGPWRYHMTLPVSGNYLQVRQFITFVLREVPAASLDDVQLRREPGAGERVDARLRFSLHFAPS